MTRADVHSPANFNPGDYRIIAYEDAHPDEGGFWVEADDLTRDQALQLIEENIVGHAAERNQCSHCGHQHLRYMAFFQHVPTGEVIGVGMDCARERFAHANRAIYLAMKDMKAAAAKRRLELDKAAFIAADDQNRTVIDFLREQVEEKGNYGYEGFYHSLLSAFNRYGELTQRQVEAALKAKERDEKWAAERAEAQANDPDPAPVVEGKAIEVTGKILTTKWQEGLYGETHKMLVLDDRGFKVWSTVPGKIGNCEQATDGLRGHRITFTAQIDQSKDDETFGFAKRPRKAEIVDQEALDV